MKIKQFEAYNHQGVNIGKAIQTGHVDKLLRVVVETLVNGSEKKRQHLAIELNRMNLNIRRQRQDRIRSADVQALTLPLYTPGTH